MTTMKKNDSFGERLLRAAREANAIARGEADPLTYRIYVPEGLDLGAIHHAKRLAQEEFAARCGLPIATVRDWEE